MSITLNIETKGWSLPQEHSEECFSCFEFLPLPFGVVTNKKSIVWLKQSNSLFFFPAVLQQQISSYQQETHMQTHTHTYSQTLYSSLCCFQESKTQTLSSFKWSLVRIILTFGLRKENTAQVFHINVANYPFAIN